ncbi:hypothetical protein PACTADRAFT_76968 [Pachysolen tannophilus NRRL Y-2460]|uniref:SPX domain-containing protein n=1 Tax=Pachysolen tannophilus NRRL Y-2460 TaxID=669874 RepID=A0A1E4TRH7_PACTA|nr:hypothetical protein PACTADRAFT_76968 [Pachysolen tannophilus NRRL Y-2460]
MKFSHSLQFNAVPEWKEHYLNYPSLKKLIYSLANGNPQSQTDSNPRSKYKNFKLKNYGNSFVIQSFLEELKNELFKIDNFYKTNEQKIYDQFNCLLHDLERTEETIFEKETNFKNKEDESSFSKSFLESTSNCEVEIEIENQNENENPEVVKIQQFLSETTLLDDSDLHVNTQEKIKLKKTTTYLFILLSEVKSFIELNRIGFNKIAKKFDKVFKSSVKVDFIDNGLFFEKCYIFQDSTLQFLEKKLEQVCEIYWKLTDKQGNLDDCRIELKKNLKEHIIWERNTVWKNIISLERQKNDFNIRGQPILIGDEVKLNELNNLETLVLTLPFPIFIIDQIKIPKFLYGWKALKLVIIIIITSLLLAIETVKDQEQRRCIALLTCVVLMWITEVLPLFVTAILVPFLVVVFGVLKDDENGNAMPAFAASRFIFGTMWSSTIMLLLGGFTLAAALSKYDITKILSSNVLALAGTNPKNVIFAIMFVAAFLSMWISNVAAPVLCFSFCEDLIKSQPANSPFIKAMILGVAFASNIGGMISPIASPQNMIAMEYMDPNPGWGKWFSIAIPVSLLSLLANWLLIIYTFKISTDRIKPYKYISCNFNFNQWLVCLVTVTTILLWCLMTKIQTSLGESGQVSIIPIVIFYGLGILKPEDICNYPWPIVILAMGGIALGKAVSSSGLLKSIAVSLQPNLVGFNIYLITLILCLMILVMATFISHTVAVLITAPLFKEIGNSLPKKHSSLLLMGAALIASAAMALPTSGFPNITAISMTDEVGRPILSVNTFITRGIPASLICFICIITVGYGIMIGIGF